MHSKLSHLLASSLLLPGLILSISGTARAEWKPIVDPPAATDLNNNSANVVDSSSPRSSSTEDPAQILIMPPRDYLNIPFGTNGRNLEDLNNHIDLGGRGNQPLQEGNGRGTKEPGGNQTPQRNGSLPNRGVTNEQNQVPGPDSSGSTFTPRQRHDLERLGVDVNRANPLGNAGGGDASQDAGADGGTRPDGGGQDAGADGGTRPDGGTGGDTPHTPHDPGSPWRGGPGHLPDRPPVTPPEPIRPDPRPAPSPNPAVQPPPPRPHQSLPGQL